MNRYKQIFSRVPDNGNLERRLLHIPDWPKAKKETPAVFKFAAIAAAACVLVAAGAIVTQFFPLGGGDFIPGGVGTETPGPHRTGDEYLYPVYNRETGEREDKKVPAISLPDVIGSWEEAVQTASFPLVRPTLAPWDGEPARINMIGDHTVFLHYRLPGSEERTAAEMSGTELAAYMYISQQYAGHEKIPFDYPVPGKVTTVWQDGVEITVYQPYEQGMTLSLYWQPYDILYTLYGFRSLDTMLAVVASMEPVSPALPDAAEPIEYYTRAQLQQISADKTSSQYYAYVRQPHTEGELAGGLPNTKRQKCDNTYYFLLSAQRVCSTCGYIFTAEQNAELPEELGTTQVTETKYQDNSTMSP
jgi:hypothetical protein